MDETYLPNPAHFETMSSSQEEIEKKGNTTRNSGETITKTHKPKKKKRKTPMSEAEKEKRREYARWYRLKKKEEQEEGYVPIPVVKVEKVLSYPLSEFHHFISIPEYTKYSFSPEEESNQKVPATTLKAFITREVDFTDHVLLLSCHDFFVRLFEAEAGPVGYLTFNQAIPFWLLYGHLFLSPRGTQKPEVYEIVCYRYKRQYIYKRERSTNGVRKLKRSRTILEPKNITPSPKHTPLCTVKAGVSGVSSPNNKSDDVIESLSRPSGIEQKMDICKGGCKMVFDYDKKVIYFIKKGNKHNHGLDEVFADTIGVAVKNYLRILKTESSFQAGKSNIYRFFGVSELIKNDEAGATNDKNYVVPPEIKDLARFYGIHLVQSYCSSNVKKICTSDTSLQKLLKPSSSTANNNPSLNLNEMLEILPNTVATVHDDLYQMQRISTEHNPVNDANTDIKKLIAFNGHAISTLVNNHIYFLNKAGIHPSTSETNMLFAMKNLFGGIAKEN
ncbi:unnamed protein product [Ambrosiozyma monospora]|uniref:Unnamed protein product n=1 Tax=Ambrosiozyma monospora TaxID=43982 RepID=A0A9W6YQJ5_AMBMO|nr:unnamed protein product [Ambrosiozyma monospora]